MRNSLPKVLIITLICAAIAVFPSHSFASQFSLIFPVPTITIPPMPNSLPSQNVSTINRSVQIEVSTNGTTETTIVSTSPTATQPTPTSTTKPTTISQPIQ